MNIIPSFSALTSGFKDIFQLRHENIAARNFIACYFANWDFDEEWYLNNYPDLTAAIPSEVFPSAYSHFAGAGYLEGRLPVRPMIDAGWYLSTYPDVAAAIIRGTVESAESHYLASGYNEGRLPAAPEIDVAWYREVYLDSKATDADCEAHFVNIGYLNGALPRAGRS